MTEARKAGRLPGKQPKLTALQQKRLYDDYQRGKYTTDQRGTQPFKRSAIYATLNREHERRELDEIAGQ